MKGIVRSPGGLDRLELVDLPDPAPPARARFGSGSTPARSTTTTTPS